MAKRPFSPSVKAGILKPEELSGYRNNPVYIRSSQHVPPAPNKLMDAMESYFSSLKNEADPLKRAILGHFMFVYIHPFQDGNGRIGRFIMNALLTAAGFPWTTIRVSQRQQYMASLEKGSIDNDIRSFFEFVTGEMQAAKLQSQR